MELSKMEFAALTASTSYIYETQQQQRVLFFAGRDLKLQEGFGKALIRAERERMLLPQHPGAPDMSVVTTSKHVGIFQLLRSSVGSLAFECVCRQLRGETERVVGTETL